MGVFCNTVNDMTSYPFSIFQFFKKMCNWLYWWKKWSFYGTSGNTLQNSKFKTCRLTKAIKLMEASPGSLWVIVQYVLRIHLEFTFLYYSYLQFGTHVVLNIDKNWRCQSER